MRTTMRGAGQAYGYDQVRIINVPRSFIDQGVGLRSYSGEYTNIRSGFPIGVTCSAFAAMPREQAMSYIEVFIRRELPDHFRDYFDPLHAIYVDDFRRWLSYQYDRIMYDCAGRRTTTHEPAVAPPPATPWQGYGSTTTVGFTYSPTNLVSLNSPPVALMVSTKQAPVDGGQYNLPVPDKTPYPTGLPPQTYVPTPAPAPAAPCDTTCAPSGWGLSSTDRNLFEALFAALQKNGMTCSAWGGLSDDDRRRYVRLVTQGVSLDTPDDDKEHGLDSVAWGDVWFYDSLCKRLASESDGVFPCCDTSAGTKGAGQAMGVPDVSWLAVGVAGVAGYLVGKVLR